MFEALQARPATSAAAVADKQDIAARQPVTTRTLAAGQESGTDFSLVPTHGLRVASFAPALAGEGRPLDAEVRGRAEASFGVPLGQVRVHDGREGQALAGAHFARAVTVGTHIAFNRGFFRPWTLEGKQLLAHELAHVAQQSGAAGPTSAGPHHEAAADSAAADLMAGRDGRSVLRTGAPVGAQAQPLTTREIESLDEDRVRERLAHNAMEREVIIFSEAYQAELSREKMLLESRKHQLADRTALVAEVLGDLTDVSAVVARMAMGVFARPEDFAMNEVRGVAMRLEFGQEYSATLAAGLSGEHRRTLKAAAEHYAELRVLHKPAVASAEAWHAANPMGQSLEMQNEDVGTHMASVASRHWDKGGWYYLSGAGAYFLTGVVAVVDATETVASFGFHGVATAVATAYARGDISWNEGKRLLRNAAAEALLKAAITRGLGAATSRIGLVGGRALGLAGSPLSVRMLFGLAVGGLSGAADLGIQHGLHALIRGHFNSPTARAIAELGKPSGMQWAIAVPLSALLGGTGALPNKPIRFGGKDLIGSTIETPMGQLKVAAITKEGQLVLQPRAATTLPPPTPPADIDLFFNPRSGAWEMPGPNGDSMVLARPASATPTVSGLARSAGRVGSPKPIGPPPRPPQLAQVVPTSTSVAGAEEVRLSQSEYEAALNMVHPGTYTSWVARVVDDVGARAAQLAMRNPRFVEALNSGNMKLAGTFFHSAAAQEVRALPDTALPNGWSITAEEVIQSGLGGSRTDVLLRGPGGVLMEFDWKTTGSSGLSSKSRSEMARHAGQIRMHVGGGLQTQQTVTWMDYVRPLL